MTLRERETTNSGRSKRLHASVSLAREIIHYYYCLSCFNIYVHQIWCTLLATNFGTKIIPLLQKVIIGNKSLLASNRYQLLQLFIVFMLQVQSSFPTYKDIFKIIPVQSDIELQLYLKLHNNLRKENFDFQMVSVVSTKLIIGKAMH